MQTLLALLFVIAPFTQIYAALNGACTANGVPGVCISTASCASGGGKSQVGFCPNDPTDIKCCTKTTCGNGGNCRQTSKCASGKTQTGLCPGPADFKCCLPASSSGGSASCTPPPVNAATVNLIKEFEGFVPKPAPDPIGLPTVGFGHLCKQKNCAEVPFAFPLTKATAASLLQRDIKTFTQCVSDAVKDTVKLNANQYGALASWAFNDGCGTVKSSTLIKRLNNGENPNTVVSQELPKFNKAKGKVLGGLTRRRAAEVKLFQTASSTISHPACQ